MDRWEEHGEEVEAGNDGGSVGCLILWGATGAGAEAAGWQKGLRPKEMGPAAGSLVYCVRQGFLVI